MSREWYVAMTVPVHERYAASLLIRERIETFLPECIERYHDVRSGKPYQRRELMFPGYLFAAIDVATPEIGTLCRTPGIAMILRDQGQPKALKGDIIVELKDRVARDGGAVRLDRPFKFQEQLRITDDGPLSGRVGGFLWQRGDRIALLMLAFKRSTVVEIASSRVQRA